MKVLVIIVTYNGLKWVDRCFPSLKNSSIPVDCIVIDNNSSDDTIQEIQKKYPEVKVVETGDNLGFGRANNIGLQYAIDNNYDYAYLLNQDAWLKSKTLQLLIEQHKKHKEYGVLSPLQMNSTFDCLDKNFYLCCSKQMLNDGLIGNLQDLYETQFVMAAHWLLPIDTIKKVGGFSPSFPHYGEDHDYLNRVKFQGLKIGIVPKAWAVHDRQFRKDSKSKKMRMTYMGAIARISNPQNDFNKQILVEPYKLIKASIKLQYLPGIKYIFQLLSNYKKFNRNKKLAFKSAFLNVK